MSSPVRLVSRVQTSRVASLISLQVEVDGRAAPTLAADASTAEEVATGEELEARALAQQCSAGTR